MKSVIVANDFLTTLANNDVSKLTRGQAVLLNSAGKVVAAASDVKDDEMLQFVLGLVMARLNAAFGLILSGRSNIRKSILLLLVKRISLRIS